MQSIHSGALLHHYGTRASSFNKPQLLISAGCVVPAGDSLGGVSRVRSRLQQIGLLATSSTSSQHVPIFQ
jgi:hypothetical protein